MTSLCCTNNETVDARYLSLLAGNVYLVTGGDRGLGFEVVRQLLLFGAHVILSSHKEDRGQAAVNYLRQETGSSRVSFLPMDLSDAVSIRLGSAGLLDLGLPLHGIVHAADYGPHKPQRFSNVGLDQHLQVNHFGLHYLAEQLTDKLKESSRLKHRSVTAAATAVVGSSTGIPGLAINSSAERLQWLTNSRIINVLPDKFKRLTTRSEALFRTMLPENYDVEEMYARSKYASALNLSALRELHQNQGLGFHLVETGGCSGNHSSVVDALREAMNILGILAGAFDDHPIVRGFKKAPEPKVLKNQKKTGEMHQWTKKMAALKFEEAFMKAEEKFTSLPPAAAPAQAQVEVISKIEKVKKDEEVLEDDLTDFEDNNHFY